MATRFALIPARRAIVDRRAIADRLKAADRADAASILKEALAAGREEICSRLAERP